MGVPHLLTCLEHFIIHQEPQGVDSQLPTTSSSAILCADNYTDNALQFDFVRLMLS